MKTIMDILTLSNIQFMIFTGAKYSLLLAMGALFFGVILGIIGAALKLSKHFVLRAIGNVYVEIFRGTPMLLQIMFLYLAVPTVVQSITGQRFQADPYVCGLIAKKHPKFNNKLIPVQNLLIGIIVAIINYIITKDFNASIMVAGLLTGGAYDLGKNLSELLKKESD